MFKELLLSLLLAVPVGAQSLETKSYSASVVLFSELSSAIIKPTCSGAVIKKEAEGYVILTAAHCVATVDEFGRTEIYSRKMYANSSVSTKGAVEVKVRRVGDLAQGEDYAILFMPSSKQYSVLEIQKTLKKDFEEVFVIGAPLGIGKLFLRGYIAEPDGTTRRWGDKVFLLQVLGVFDGSSGGPVVCASTGQICGILVGGIEPVRIAVALDLNEVNVGY